jgi:ABC-type Na+ efflux pump permease subunit
MVGVDPVDLVGFSVSLESECFMSAVSEGSPLFLSLMMSLLFALLLLLMSSISIMCLSSLGRDPHEPLVGS